MFEPIERRNCAGDVVQRLQISEAGDRAVILIEEGDGGVGFDLDDAALDEAITQLSILRTNRKLARDVAQAGRENAAERLAHRLNVAFQRGL